MLPTILRVWPSPPAVWSLLSFMLCVQVQVKARLARRCRCTAQELAAALQQQADSFMQRSVTPAASLYRLPPGSFYLDSVDSLYRRVYKRTETEPHAAVN